MADIRTRLPRFKATKTTKGSCAESRLQKEFWTISGSTTISSVNFTDYVPQSPFETRPGGVQSFVRLKTLMSVQYKSLLDNSRTRLKGGLGHFSCFANISVPRASAAREYSRRVIEKAADNVGLRLTHAGLTSISGMALRHYNVNDLADGVPILVVDSSASGLSLTTISVEDGVFDTLRSSLNITVPSANQSGRPSAFPGPDDKICRFSEQSVREALMNIIASTQESENNFVGVHDWKLIVYGDRTYDEYLLSELDGIFPLETIQRAPDPDAPALGAAHVAFWRFNDVSQYEGVPTLCCWRSWGKGCPTHRMRIDF